jgi:hypothetical protein
MSAISTAGASRAEARPVWPTDPGGSSSSAWAYS